MFGNPTITVRIQHANTATKRKSGRFRGTWNEASIWSDRREMSDRCSRLAILAYLSPFLFAHPRGV